MYIKNDQIKSYGFIINTFEKCQYTKIGICIMMQKPNQSINRNTGWYSWMDLILSEQRCKIKCTSAWSSKNSEDEMEYNEEHKKSYAAI